MFIRLLFSDPRMFFSLAMVVIISVCIHEYMHACTALKNGDPTAAEAGHLTLNPFKQMGIWSLITFCLIGIAWGQVPVNRTKLSTRQARLAVALAGVAANLLLALLFFILLIILANYFPHHATAQQVVFFGATVNLVLFAVNLFPIPGFDGWNVLTEFWNPSVSSELIKGVFFIMVILLFLGISYIQKAAEIIIVSCAYFVLELLK